MQNTFWKIQAAVCLDLFNRYMTRLLPTNLYCSHKLDNIYCSFAPGVTDAGTTPCQRGTGRACGAAAAGRPRGVGRFRSAGSVRPAAKVVRRGQQLSAPLWPERVGECFDPPPTSLDQQQPGGAVDQGWPRHREDHGGAASRRVPALHATLSENGDLLRQSSHRLSRRRRTPRRHRLDRLVYQTRLYIPQ